MQIVNDYRKKATVLDPLLLERTLTRLAHQIMEHQRQVDRVVLIGIRSRGDVLAKRLAAIISRIEGVSVATGALDITFHRDDVNPQSAIHNPHLSSIPCSLADRIVVLIDDVLFTGRSVRAALDALLEFGRPAKIQLAVLIDRGHREYPIRADYVGKNIPTSLREDVKVSLKEVDGEDSVVIRESVK